MLPSAVAHSPAKQQSHHFPKGCIRAREDRNNFHQVLNLNLNLETHYISLILLLMLMWKDNLGKNC